MRVYVSLTVFQLLALLATTPIPAINRPLLRTEIIVKHLGGLRSSSAAAQQSWPSTGSIWQSYLFYEDWDLSNAQVKDGAILPPIPSRDNKDVCLNSRALFYCMSRPYVWIFYTAPYDLISHHSLKLDVRCFCYSHIFLKFHSGLHCTPNFML